FCTGTQSLADFDPLTGLVTNVITLPNVTGFSAAFSPDNTKLYAYHADSLCQFDISLNSSAAIMNSKVALSEAAYVTARLGPDNRIYVFLDNTSSIGRINRPNLSGAACQFDPHAVTMPPEQNGKCFP